MTAVVSLAPQDALAAASALQRVYGPGVASASEPLVGAPGGLAAQLTRLDATARRTSTSLADEGTRFAARARTAVGEVQEADRWR